MRGRGGFALRLPSADQPGQRPRLRPPSEAGGGTRCEGGRRAPGGSPAFPRRSGSWSASLFLGTQERSGPRSGAASGPSSEPVAVAPPPPALLPAPRPAKRRGQSPLPAPGGVVRGTRGASSRPRGERRRRAPPAGTEPRASPPADAPVASRGGPALGGDSPRRAGGGGHPRGKPPPRPGPVSRLALPAPASPRASPGRAQGGRLSGEGSVERPPQAAVARGRLPGPGARDGRGSRLPAARPDPGPASALAAQSRVNRLGPRPPLSAPPRPSRARPPARLKSGRRPRRAAGLGAGSCLGKYDSSPGRRRGRPGWTARISSSLAATSRRCDPPPASPPGQGGQHAGRRLRMPGWGSGATWPACRGCPVPGGPFPSPRQPPRERPGGPPSRARGEAPLGHPLQPGSSWQGASPRGCIAPSRPLQKGGPDAELRPSRGLRLVMSLCPRRCAALGSGASGSRRGVGRGGCQQQQQQQPHPWRSVPRAPPRYPRHVA